jgi:hypothetical protein
MYRELEEVVRAEAGEEEAADVAVEVLAVDLPHVAVAVGPHEHVQLLPHRVHGERTGGRPDGVSGEAGFR